jgi:hypothetical protein
MEGNHVGGSDARVESPRFDSRGGCWDKIPAQCISDITSKAKKIFSHGILRFTEMVS